VRRCASMGTSYCPVSVSLTSRCSVEVVGQTELVFGMEASGFFRPVVFDVLRKFRDLQGYEYFHQDIFPKLWKIFATAYRSSSVLSTLLEIGGDAQSVINWTVVGKLSGNSSDFRCSTTVLYCRQTAILSF